MQRVITINGNAYQLVESGYDVLRDYPADAERALAANSDAARSWRISSKPSPTCRIVLGPHKSVVEAAEIAQIVKEMGPIDVFIIPGANTPELPAPAPRHRVY